MFPVNRLELYMQVPSDDSLRFPRYPKYKKQNNKVLNRELLVILVYSLKHRDPIKHPVLRKSQMLATFRERRGALRDGVFRRFLFAVCPFDPSFPETSGLLND